MESNIKIGGWMALHTSRQRTDGIINNSPYYVRWLQPYTGWNSLTSSCGYDPTRLKSTSSGTFQTDLWDVVCKDNVIPNFRKNVAHGKLYFNDFQKVERRILCDGIIDREIYKKDSHGCRYGGHTVMPTKYPVINPSTYVWRNPPEPSTSIESEKNRLLIEAIDKARVSEALLLATLGEFEETVQGIASVLAMVADVLAAYRSKRFLSYLSKKSTVKNAKDIWMQIRYSLRPLYYEIKNYTEAFAQIGIGETRRQTFRAFGQLSGSSTYSDTLTTSEYKRFTREEHTLSYSIRTGCLADIQIDLQSILGLDHIFESAWELIPLSFVIDWFCNIGRIISRLDPCARRRILGDWCSIERYHLKTVHTTGYAVLPPSYGTINDWGSLSYEHITKTRTCMNEISNWPTLSVRLSTFKLIDLAAIISNIFRSKSAILSG